MKPNMTAVIVLACAVGLVLAFFWMQVSNARVEVRHRSSLPAHSVKAGNAN